MSTGALFNLVANDGKADRMILATELIQKRICDIQCYKRSEGFKFTQPTLAELEKTHILFMTAHYKPFIATAFEYLKESVASGTARWGNDVKYSIPQAGDFFHDMIVHLQTDELQGTEGSVPTLDEGDFPESVDAAETKDVTDIANGVVTYESGVAEVARITKEYVNAKTGQVVAGGAQVQGLVRWVEWPGIKALRHVEFEINSSKLDEYTSDTMVFHKIFRLHINKVNGFKKLMGQDIGVESLSETKVSSSSVFGDLAVRGLETSDGDAMVPSANNLGDSVSSSGRVFEGYQTPDNTKPGLDLWIPLIFWFNCSVSLAIPSVSIPYGQRFIKIDLENFNKVARPVAGAIQLRTKVETWETDNGTVGGDAPTNYKVSYHSDDAQLEFSGNNGVDTNSGRITNINLWVSHIYVIPEVHDIFIQRIGFNLIRIYKQQNEDISSANSSGDGQGVELSSLKFPVETMYFGYQPEVNTEAGEDYWRSWHRFSSLTRKELVQTVQVPGVLSEYDSVGTANVLGSQTLATVQVSKMTYWKQEATVRKIGLRSHGIQLFQNIEERFWNSYIPYKFGGYNVNTPEQEGVYMINFAQYPGDYQPSGHFNYSRAKQSYLIHQSEFINTANIVKLKLLAIALNFLVISDGSAVIRYST